MGDLIQRVSGDSIPSCEKKHRFAETHLGVQLINDEGGIPQIKNKRPADFKRHQGKNRCIRKAKVRPVAEDFIALIA